MLAGDCTRYQFVLVFLFSGLIHQGCLFEDRVVTSPSPRSAIYRCHLQELLEGLSEEVVLVDMHVQPQWVNKLLFPPFIKDKWGELPMTPRLAALGKRVAELRVVGLKACHYAEIFTLQRICSLDHQEKLAFECPWLADPSCEPADGKIFILQVLLVTICYSNLIHSFFCSALTKVEIDRLVGIFLTRIHQFRGPTLWPHPIALKILLL
jgi:hypothetical protein